MFLTKYDRLGYLVWARQLGDQYMQVAPRGLAVDAATNIWMIGHLEWPSSGSIGGVMVRPASVFVAKCDHLGNPVWVRGIASGPVRPKEIALDAAGNSYCDGYASGPATLDGTPVGSGGWLLKLDGEGNQLWSRTFPGNPWRTTADTLAVDPQGKVFLGGRFDGTVVFAETNSLTAAGNSDLFFARYDASGKLLWVNQVGGTNENSIDWSGVDAAGNWYVEGQFQSSATFSGVMVGSGTTDWHTFVTKYDRDGHLQWVRVIFEEQYGQLALFAVEAAGNSFITMATGTNGHVLQKLDPAGDLQWTKFVQSPIQLRLAADQVGNLYWGASFDSSTYQLDSFTLTSSVPHSFDLALAKLDTTTPPRLEIERKPDGVQLSWSALATDYYLECSTEAGSAFWASNTAVPSVIGASNRVAVSSAGDRMFFRLKRP
jgi:hypothetical protein